MAYRTDTHIRTGRGVWIGGAIAGIIAGLALGAFAMMYAAIMGMGFWAPLKMIAATLFGDPALIGGVGVIMTGLIIHMMVSAVFGIIFAALLPRGAGGGTALLAGVAYGFAIWAVMTYLVLPWANATMYPRVQMLMGSFIFEHLLFGAVLAITPGLVRRYSARVPEVRTMPERRAA